MHLQLVCLLVCLTSMAYCLMGIGRDQSVAVQGRLICNGMPASNVKVKLYEKETTFDKKLDESRTDGNGYFRLSGWDTEITDIDPKVNIYHSCNYRGPCSQKIGITIPDNYISRGRTPQKIFDLGTVNLAGRFAGQTTDCIN